MQKYSDPVSEEILASPAWVAMALMITSLASGFYAGARPGLPSM
jgi:hypothetical protein